MDALRVDASAACDEFDDWLGRIYLLVASDDFVLPDLYASPDVCRKPGFHRIEIESRLSTVDASSGHVLIAYADNMVDISGWLSDHAEVTGSPVGDLSPPHHAPRLSPSGTGIVYTTVSDGTYKLVLADAGGGAHQALLSNSSGTLGPSAWVTPNLVATVVSSDNEYPSTEIAVIDIRDGRTKHVFGMQELGIVDVGNLVGSGDGMLALTTSVVNSSAQTVLLEVATGQHERLSGWRVLDWSEDGDWTLVMSDQTLAVAPTNDLSQVIEVGTVVAPKVVIGGTWDTSP